MTTPTAPPPPRDPRRTQTRRGFLALLGVTAAAVAVRLPPEPERPRSTWAGKTRWIGHC